MRGLAQDVRTAAQALRRRPRFSAAVTATMALGIGLNSAVFSLLDALLLRPPAVSAPERLAHVYSAAPGGFLSHEPMAFPDYEALRDGTRSFASVAAYAWCPLALQHAGGSELIMGEIVTGNYFATLGVSAASGRILGAADEDRAAPRRAAVLSHDTWLRHFAGSRDVVGRTVHLNGRPFTVVGIAPRGFRGLTAGFAPDVWLPIHAAVALPMGVTINVGGYTPGVERLADRASRWVWVTGRLRPGASVRAAGAEAAVLASQLGRAFPATNARRAFSVVGARDVRLFPGLDTAVWTGAMLVSGVFALGLLLASTNVAALFLAHALSRRREIATRLALGATRARLVRQLFCEGLLVALAGCALGLAFAHLSSERLGRIETPALSVGWPLDLVLAPSVDWRVLAFALAAAALTAVVFALAPALEATRVDLSGMLRETGAGAKLRGPSGLRDVLVAAQVAVSVVLLSGAAVALRVLSDAARIDPGFDAKQAAVLTLSPDLLGYGGDESERLFARVRERVAALPGVRSVALASHLPLTLAINWRDVAPVGGGSAIRVDWAGVSPGYFETMRIPLVDGRPFAETDGPGARGVVIVNQTLARRLWPDSPAVGRRLADGTVVVGVARDGKYRTLGEGPRPFVYTCLGQDRRQTRTLIARTAGDPRSILPALRAEVGNVDPRVPVGRPGTLGETVGDALMMPRVAAGLLGVFSLLGVALAAAGIFGVVAYLASARTAEIGLRLALGATRSAVVGWLLQRALRSVLVGLGAGLAVAAAANRALAGVAAGLRSLEWPALLSAACVLALVGGAAAALPARRAACLDPAEALRHE